MSTQKRQEFDIIISIDRVQFFFEDSYNWCIFVIYSLCYLYGEMDIDAIFYNLLLKYICYLINLSQTILILISFPHDIPNIICRNTMLS
jgi:hypothetical protein